MSIKKVNDDDEEIDNIKCLPRYREICETRLEDMSPPFIPYLICN